MLIDSFGIWARLRLVTHHLTSRSEGALLLLYVLLLQKLWTKNLVTCDFGVEVDWHCNTHFHAQSYFGPSDSNNFPELLSLSRYLQLLSEVVSN